VPKKTLFEIKDVDRAFYAEKLQSFLPDRMIDVHTHLWRTAHSARISANAASRVVSWPGRVAKENPAEHLIETYSLLFPDKQVTPLVFASLPAQNLNAINSYVRSAARSCGFPSLLFSDPRWSGAELERRIGSGGFLGIKSYLTMAPQYIPGKEIRILDFFPPHQLEILNAHRWILMLHIPRDGRLKDPVNLGQMLEIEERYPRVQVVIAHVGRAYCAGDVGNAFEVLARTKRMSFDFSANTNAQVFEQLIETVGPKRILFGSDLPITRMRMRRIERDGRYVNLVPKGMYGDVSADPNMGELSGRDAEALTFFLYEEIDAFRIAAGKTGLSRRDVANVFCDNARRMIEAAMPMG